MYNLLTKAEAEIEYNELKATNYKPLLHPSDHEMREALYGSYYKVISRNEQIGKYEIDLEFGLELYSILTIEGNLTERLASLDDVWIYLSMRVIPDIVHHRWGDSANRFYKVSNRIWLKSIWWYIHIGFYKSKEETKLLLQNNSTDTIMQLLDRTGTYGFNLSLYHEILYYYGKNNYVEKKNRGIKRLTGQDFRRAMKKNIYLSSTIIPEMYPGGIKKYVEMLFKK